MRNTTIPISHHRCGIRALIQIHQTERGLLALSVVQALQEAAFPYIELYDSARIIDLVIEEISLQPAGILRFLPY